MQIKQKLGHNSFILLKWYANYLMKLSKNQPRGNNRHCLERFPSVSNPHLTLHPGCPASPPHTLPLWLLRLLRVEPAKLSTPSPCTAPSRTLSLPCCSASIGPQPWFSGRSHATGEHTTWARIDLECPAACCLPHYRKPLCLHCVGAVIFEASGDTLRSLLSEISCLARITLHEPLAAVRPSPRHGSVISAHLAASCLGLRQQSMMAAEKGGRDSTQEGEGLGPDTCWGLGQVEGASSRRSYWCPLHP